MSHSEDNIKAALGVIIQLVDDSNNDKIPANIRLEYIEQAKDIAKQHNIPFEYPDSMIYIEDAEAFMDSDESDNDTTDFIDSDCSYGGGDDSSMN